MSIPAVAETPPITNSSQSASVALMDTLYKPLRLVASTSVTVPVVNAADTPSFTRRGVMFAASPVLGRPVAESTARKVAVNATALVGITGKLLVGWLDSAN